MEAWAVSGVGADTVGTDVVGTDVGWATGAAVGWAGTGD
jgi:hypothetical protein